MLESNHPQINCRWKTEKFDSSPERTWVSCLCEGKGKKYVMWGIMLIPSHKIPFESIIFSLENNNKYAIRTLNTHTAHNVPDSSGLRKEVATNRERQSNAHCGNENRCQHPYSILSEFTCTDKSIDIVCVSHWPDDYTMLCTAIVHRSEPQRKIWIAHGRTENETNTKSAAKETFKNEKLDAAAVEEWQGQRWGERHRDVESST